jgi:hypothetical protein
MATTEVVLIIAVTFIVLGIPLTGFMIRFALRPLVQDIARAIGAQGSEEGEFAELIRRLDRIEGRLEDQDRRMDELVQANRFYGQLESGRGEAAGDAGAGGAMAP